MRKLLTIAAMLVLVLLGGVLLLTAWPDPLEPIATGGPRLVARPVLVLRDADGPERAAAFSPDGTLLATASAAGPVQLRRSGSWQRLSVLPHPAGATALAFTPDGGRLVTAGYDGIVRVWDLRPARLLRAIRASDRTIWTVDVSPDGQRVAGGGEDGIVRVWDLRTGSVLQALRGHERNIWEVRFSPDRPLVASAGFDRTIRLWDARGARILAGHGQAVVGLAFRPDGRWLASSGDDSTLRFWRAADGALVRTLRAGNHTYRLAFSRDGAWLASGGRARTAALSLWHQLTGLGGAGEAVRIWRVADGALVQSLALDDDALSAPAFSPDGGWLITGDETSAVTIWQLKGR